jgi:hypothetical protein
MDTVLPNSKMVGLIKYFFTIHTTVGDIIDTIILYFLTATYVNLRFVTFLVTEYDEVFSGYQPGQLVEQWKTNITKIISVLVLRVLD